MPRTDPRIPKSVPSLTASRVAAFWRHVDKRGSDECWPWLGRLTDDGYGRFGDLLAHRVTYAISVGPIPDGMTLDHYVCASRSCVNSAHLEPVTDQENTRRARERPSQVRYKARRRTSERFHRRRARGLCIQCNTESVKSRCDRCREIHNAKSRWRRSNSTASDNEVFRDNRPTTEEAMPSVRPTVTRKMA